MNLDDPNADFCVLVNAEGQHSIWPKDKAIPEGWRAEGFSGPRAACTQHVDAVWTDMTPKSLRVSG